MSNHFTYEIDERNIRIQMKEFVLPVKEDAWQKFESYTDTMVNDKRENRFRNFNLNLNRNVVLPAVFGVIIILFSFLLVNFVSIKNPLKEGHKAEVNAAAIKATPQQQEPVKEKVAAPAQEVTVAAVEQTTVAPEVKVEESTVAAATMTETTQATAQTAVVSETHSDSVASTEAKTEAPAKKKRKRRSSDVVEQQLMDIRPTIVAEEGDSEVRPN